MDDHKSQVLVASRPTMDEYREDEREILKVLRSFGLEAPDINGLGTRARDWKREFEPAVPALAALLPTLQDSVARQRVMSAFGGRYAAAAIPALLDWSHRAPADIERWTAGSQLARMLPRDLQPYEAELTEALEDRTRGESRQRLAVAVAKCGGDTARDALLTVLDEPGMSGHVLEGLRKMKAEVPQDRLAPYVTSGHAWVRAHARALVRE